MTLFVRVKFHLAVWKIHFLSLHFKFWPRSNPDITQSFLSTSTPDMNIDKPLVWNKGHPVVLIIGGSYSMLQKNRYEDKSNKSMNWGSELLECSWWHAGMSIKAYTVANKFPYYTYLSKTWNWLTEKVCVKGVNEYKKYSILRHVLQLGVLWSRSLSILQKLNLLQHFSVFFEQDNKRSGTVWERESIFPRDVSELDRWFTKGQGRKKGQLSQKPRAPVTLCNSPVTASEASEVGPGLRYEFMHCILSPMSLHSDFFCPNMCERTRASVYTRACGGARICGE